MVKRKVSLNDGEGRSARRKPVQATSEVIDLFFNTGVIHHELVLDEGLPDHIVGFKVEKGADNQGFRVRAAEPGEDPEVEVAPVEHVAELSNRWLPIPYQLSCPLAVQVRIAVSGRRGIRLLLAIDTLEAAGNGGKHLDGALDAGRPFRPLEKGELGAFLDHPEARELVRHLEEAGVDRAPFKFAALLDTLAPLLPRMRFSRVSVHTPVPASLVLDFGNSRSSALLVESREGEVFSSPLEVRDSSNPFRVSDETFGSRITFLPNAFDEAANPVAVGGSFQLPSIAVMGREALDRALETPHRYQCSLSGPKRYLWDADPTDERWFFAQKRGGEYAPISGRILKYLVENTGGLTLRQDGPTAPADPRYAPRTMMLFAIVELLVQAWAQINSVEYRKFQGKEGNPRVLKHLVITYPSAMRGEERRVYQSLVQNAVVLASYLLNLAPEQRPNYDPTSDSFSSFLLVDEALAAQMVYLYQEVVHTFGGNMEEFVGVYGRTDGTVRIASVDIGGGTSDVMIAEFADKLPGTGTALSVKKLFQDGVSIAGDDVCRAICEDIVIDQMMQQLPSRKARAQLAQLFGEGGGSHGAAFRTLKAKLVPYFWMPLARCYWALAEGFEIPEHYPERIYSIAEIFQVFQVREWSPAVLAEADAFLGQAIPGFPGLNNLFFRFDRTQVEAAIDRVLREPLRRYADILAQFDVDVLVLAGRTSALHRVRELFVREMPVSPPRIKTMSTYRVSEWYPPKWRDNGLIKDPKSTVAAGATILHLAANNRLPGLLIDEMHELEQKPIYGLYQKGEPHIARVNELFRDDKTSQPFVYTGGMVVGFRNVDSEEMDGSPLFSVRPANPDVEAALLDDRVSLRFRVGDGGRIEIADVKSQRGTYDFDVTDFSLSLKTVTEDRYWLDTGVFTIGRSYLDIEDPSLAELMEELA